MLMNLSAKPGETAGQNAESATTGRFGLGFKSVHLVSEKPSVVSGFLAFSIVGGLLPVEESLPNDIDNLQIADGRRATRIRLPLIDTRGLIENMFHRFKYARPLLPAFARQIREVEVNGVNSYSGSSSFEPKNIEGAPGWSIGANLVVLPGHGQWRLLRFRPRDANQHSGSEALVVGLKEDIPKKFPSEIPFLWNVTPTSEGWNCGYAVNGPFKLDPGRTHISLDDPETLEIMRRLGSALGEGLVKLYDALINGKGENVEGLPSSEKASDFLASLWKVLSTGLDTSDALRKKLLDHLHGQEKGISEWVAKRSVIATGLPKPFKPYLPALNFNENRVEQSGGDLEKAELCKAIAQVDDLSEIAKNHLVISQETASQLRPLLPNRRLRELRPSGLFLELLQKWNHFLEPNQLHSLRPLSDEDIWQFIRWNDIHSKGSSKEIRAHSKDQKAPLLRKLLIPQNQHCDENDPDLQDELLRSRFASSSFILASEYIQGPEDVVMFRRLRGRHEVGADQICSWYQYLFDDERRRDGLRYLLDGKLQQEVLQKLIYQQNRPNWLRNYDKIHSLLNELNSSTTEVNRLLIALFPSNFHQISEENESERTPPPPAPNGFFENLVDWWNDEQKRKEVIDRYEESAWPSWLRETDIAESLRSGSDDHWLGLLVLGACRSLGWAEDSHHRNFLEKVHSENWWSVFTQPDCVADWMELLKNWQDQAVSNTEYLRWMSLFPSIYQMSRYRKKYRILLLSAGKRPPELYHFSRLLSPRSDDALTGAGQHFDAPPAPINMGLHWILRELVRYGIIDEAHIFPDCWVPTKKLLDFLRKIGLDLPDNNLSNQDKARKISDFLSENVPNVPNVPNAPHLHKAFDIPLLHIRDDSDLQNQLGLEV